MRLYLAAIAFAIQCVPAIAQASLYKFDYEGHIVGGIQGNGMGYKVGDKVSGHLEFDLANSTGDLFSHPSTASYRARNDGTDFVISTSVPNLEIPGTIGGNWDQVYVLNEYIQQGTPSTRTILVFADVYMQQNPWSSYGFQINVVWDGLDWFNQDQIPEFEIDKSSPFVASNTGGTFFDATSFVLPDGTVSGGINSADFSYDYMKLSKVAVPEPETLILLLIGGLILCVRYRVFRKLP